MTLKTGSSERWMNGLKCVITVSKKSINKEKKIAGSATEAITFGVFLLLAWSILIFPAVSAANTTVNYSIRTQDLFPNIQRVDVIIQTDWSADYTSNDASGSPGATVSYPITAASGPGAIRVWWWYNGTIIKRNGERTISYSTPIGDRADIPVYDDGTFSIFLTIHSYIEGRITCTGPGSVSPSSVTWTVWGTQKFDAAIDTTAQDGQKISLTTRTIYYETLSAKFVYNGPPKEEYTSDLVSKSDEGDKQITNTITVMVPKHTITGYVYKSGTSQGISGATVTASPGGYSTTTDSAGHYSLTLPDGTYTITASAGGYQSASASITVSGSDTTKDWYLIPISGGHAITGYVYKGGSSQGISGASVTADPGSYSTTTDSAGHYSLTLPDGTYTVTASAGGYQPSSASVTVSGSDVTKDFYLIPVGSGHAITGYVYKSGTSQGISGATVTASPGGYSTTTDSAGHYSLTLPDGTYTVTVSASGYQSTTRSVTVSGSDVTIDIYLIPEGGNFPASPIMGNNLFPLIVVAIIATVLVISLLAYVSKKKKRAGIVMHQPEPQAAIETQQKPLFVPSVPSICPACKSNLRFIKEYNRWYCDKCGKYP